MSSNRINRINEEIQKELSALLRTVKDPRVQDTMISITRVETTPDLRYTKVYVSFLQEERVKDAMAGLKSAAGYLRRQLGHNLQLRYSPEIVWSEDLRHPCGVSESRVNVMHRVTVFRSQLLNRQL